MLYIQMNLRLKTVQMMQNGLIILTFVWSCYDDGRLLTMTWCTYLNSFDEIHQCENGT